MILVRNLKKYTHGRFEETFEDKDRNDSRGCSGTYCGAIVNKVEYMFTKNKKDITCPGCKEMILILNNAFPLAVVKIEE